jgi:transcriptional regulator with XRE-family HTH domain
MMQLEAKTIGRNLLLLRAKFDLSQGQVSQMTGMSRAHISQLESGKIGIPKLDSLMKFASVYKCSLYDIIFGPIDAVRNLVLDEPAHYNSALSVVIDRLKSNSQLIEIIKIELDYLSDKPVETVSDFIKLIDMCVRLPQDKLKKVIDMIKVINS